MTSNQKNKADVNSAIQQITDTGAITDPTPPHADGVKICRDAGKTLGLADGKSAKTINGLAVILKKLLADTNRVDLTKEEKTEFKIAYAKARGHADMIAANQALKRLREAAGCAKMASKARTNPKTPNGEKDTKTPAPPAVAETHAAYVARLGNEPDLLREILAKITDLTLAQFSAAKKKLSKQQLEKLRQMIA